MLEAFSRATGIPIDVPFDQLGGRHRRLIFHGTGEQWFDCKAATSGRGEAVPATNGRGFTGGVLFRFQYKGLYPALEEASRVSPALRAKLEHLVDEVECSVCGGSRLARRRRGRAAPRPHDRRTLPHAAGHGCWKSSRTGSSPTSERKIAGEVSREIRNRLQFLVDVGLDYLTLARPAPSLSGGEMQRIRLAAQVGSGLCGVLYVLDEPTIGLHPRDNRRLLDAMKKLRDLGNTLLVVEHDREVVRERRPTARLRSGGRPAGRADRRPGHARRRWPAAAARSPGRIFPARRRFPCRRTAA